MSREKYLKGVAATLGAALTGPSRVNGEQISKKEEMILREAEVEFRRRGHFSLIYPAAGTNSYRSYFEEPRNLNNLLYQRCLEKGIFTQIKQ